MHVGEKPYVVLSSTTVSALRGPLAWGQVELSSRPLPGYAESDAAPADEVSESETVLEPAAAESIPVVALSEHDFSERAAELEREAAATLAAKESALATKAEAALEARRVELETEAA